MIFYKLKQNKLFIKLIGVSVELFFLPFKVLRLTRKKKEGKTLLLSLHLLGDTVFTLPTVKYFIEKYGDNLTIVSFPASKIIYEKAGIKAEIVTVNPNDFFASGRFPKRIVRSSIKKLNPRRIIDITGGINSAFTIAGIGASEVIGMNEDIYQSLYDKFVPLRTTPHLIDKYFDVARIFDKNLDRKKYSYLPGNINNGKRILFHPFGSWKEKEWEFDNFLQLSKKLSNEGFETAFIWEKGRATDEKKELLNKFNVKLIETENLRQLFEETEKSFLFIGVDSGPIHIASLLGTSTIAIYGPTNPAFIKPEGENHFMIRKIIHCSPVNEKHYCDTFAGRTCSTLECLKELSVDEVFEKSMTFINRLKNG